MPRCRVPPVPRRWENNLGNRVIARIPNLSRPAYKGETQREGTMRSRILRTLTFALGGALLGAASAQAQPEGQPCAPEPTDQLVAYGDHVSPCAIDQDGDSDLFRFQGVAGEVVSVRVTDQLGGSLTPACSLALLRPVGTLVTSISSNTMCEIRTTLDASGLFTARVSENNNDSLMTYALEIDRLAPFSTTAASINPGAIVIGARIDPDGDADLFVFNGVNGDVVSLRGTDQAGGSGIPSIRLELFRPDGTLAASAAGNTSAIIDATLDQTGAFTLRVTENNSDSLMTYNVEYQCLVGSCPTFHKLTVGRVGSGVVTSNPIGIDCGTDCAERYFVGTVVTLTPTPGPSSAFDSWGGNPDCADGVVTITAEISCVATFVPSPTAPLLTLDKTSLYFGAVTNGTTFVLQTAAQAVRLTQTGTGTVTWTATSNQSWLQVSPASGSGSANLSISVVSVGGLPVGSRVTGAIALTQTGASNTPGPIAVSLNLVPNGTSASPFGFVDTPLDNVTGVTGAIPFTGWALDDIEVTRVMICRAALGGEVAPVDPNCGGAAQIFVGDAVFVDNARPDVQTAFPTYPRSSRAGWGFMVLTNMLPAQGNGTYVLYMHAQDRDGHTTLLGTRTMTCDNASATKPFGAIDTPTQGGTASGAAFINFGWALTPQPKIIPVNGSTITVMVDGTPLGPVDYNHERADIEALFPGFQNTAGVNGAVGFRVIDTTTLTNGLHTISWTVTDNQGMTEGIGSRFFTVSNGVGAVTAAAESATSSRRAAIAPDIATAPQDDTPVLVRRGWDLEGPWRWYGVGGAGRAVIRGEEIDRFELVLGKHSGAYYTGHMRAGEALAPLPVGSQLDASTGAFTWAPGVGFVGRYDLVFVRWAGPRALARREVRIILAPKGSGHVGVQVAIDVPRSQQVVEQPFVLAGWAADLDAASGTGIDTLHVWAYPSNGGAPVFLGTPALGGARPDVAAVHGDQFRHAGFALALQGLIPGTYDLALFPWSNVTGAFAPPNVVKVTVR
jgi:hypothetical protein